uniref:At1g61320/AtMIF1 LRR domain-containing protein n=1 Tax=Oryza punctata TaxID=4537 RepID=A0A0E0KFQ4_ORYPU
MDLPYPPLQPPPPTTAGSSMPARRTHMEDGICPVNKKRRLALGPRVEVDNSKHNGLIFNLSLTINSTKCAFGTALIFCPHSSPGHSVKDNVRTNIEASCSDEHCIERAWIFHPYLLFTAEKLFASSDRQERVLSTNGFIDTVNFILRKHSGLGVITAFRVIFSMTENGSHFKVLQLDTVTFGPTPDFCGFANLTMLTLKHVLVLDNFQYFLPKCPALEWLEILMCSQLHNLHVSEPLPRLEFLRVQGCAINKIELHAPKLTTFEYRGCFKVIIALHKCLKLKTASIVSIIEDNLEYVFSGLPNGLPHVERLRVEVFVRTQIPGFTQPPLKFTNLRHLTMRVTFGSATRFRKNAVLQLAYLLEAAPLLVDLRLHVSYYAICTFILFVVLNTP